METGSLAERIDALRSRTQRARNNAAQFAGLTVLSVLGETDVLGSPDAKIAGVKYSILFMFGGAATTRFGVSYGLNGMQMGRELVALVTVQAQRAGSRESQTSEANQSSGEGRGTP